MKTVPFMCHIRRDRQINPDFDEGLRGFFKNCVGHTQNCGGSHTEFISMHFCTQIARFTRDFQDFRSLDMKFEYEKLRL